MIPYSCPEITTQKLHRHISLLEQWFTKWRIYNNLDKTVTILFTRFLHRHLPEFTLFNEGEVQNLGITSDRKLPRNEHVNSIANKTSARIPEFYPLLGYHRNPSPVIKRQM
jgi:hypothetical protein